MKPTIHSAISTFGAMAKQKLANLAATGEPEDQLRAPFEQLLTAMAELVNKLGRTVIWLHTFGERMVDPKCGRPAQPPRLPKAKMPFIPAKGAIPSGSATMPDVIDYDAAKKRLHIGTGFVENVEPAVWHYEVSGKQVLLQWFSYRRKNRERPIIGDRRPPSALGNIQPDHWLAEYTTELINVLNVLGLLVEIEPQQAALLEKICAGPTITVEELRAAGALEVPAITKQKRDSKGTPDLFDSAKA